MKVDDYFGKRPGNLKTSENVKRVKKSYTSMPGCWLSSHASETIWKSLRSMSSSSSLSRTGNGRSQTLPSSGSWNSFLQVQCPHQCIFIQHIIIKTSNSLHALARSKQRCLQMLSERVPGNGLLSHGVRQRVPRQRTGSRRESK